MWRGRGDNEIKSEGKQGRCKILGILDKWVSKCGPQTSVSVTWGFVRNVDPWATLPYRSETGLSGFITSSPGDSDG